MAVMFITKLVVEMKYNQGILFFYHKLNRLSEEKWCQKLGYIIGK